MAKSPKPKTRHLTFLLLREEFQTPEDVLENPRSLGRKELPDDFDFGGVLYFVESSPREPRWVSFVKEGFPEGLALGPSSVAMAVLFIQVGARLFALTFGQGRHLLKPDTCERDFGLKVTLNTVDEKKLRSLDLRTFEELTVHTRRQVSRSSPVDAFSVDVVRDLLGAVTGEPSDTSLAKRLTGRDALALTGAVAFSDLATHCAALLKAYASTQYKKKFPWVDNIRLVRDRRLMDELDGALLDAINRGEHQKIYLAPPEVISWDEVAGFRYPGERVGSGAPHPDLDLETCLTILAAREGVDVEHLMLSLENLKRHHVRAVFEDSSFEPEKWPLYKCLVAELERGDALYVLSAGQWFCIQKHFAADIRQQTAALVKEIHRLPPARRDEMEDEYNKRVVGASKKSLVLFDKKLRKAKGAQTAIEACDLFSIDSQFIHVKRKARSATLSHLFSQGAVAAETFLQDEYFRERLREIVEAENPNMVKLLGNPSERPEAKRYEVVFAIITESPEKKWPQVLPFFSQLNLVRHAQRLSMVGFRVALHRIGVVAR